MTDELQQQGMRLATEQREAAVVQMLKLRELRLAAAEEAKATHNANDEDRIVMTPSLDEDDTSQEEKENDTTDDNN